LAPQPPETQLRWIPPTGLRGRTSNIEDCPQRGGALNLSGCDSDAFIAILNADGTLLRSSYLGGHTLTPVTELPWISPTCDRGRQTCSQDFPL